MKEINSTVTRRIRIWEGEKCIMAIDLQGDTIVTRPKKKNLKVSYEAFDIPMYSDVKMTNYQKIKEACQKANPKLMESSFGCEIREKRTGETTYFISESFEQCFIHDKVLCPQAFELEDYKKYYEILGHEPTLADVMIAISKTHCGLAINVDGEFKGEFLGEKFRKWDLTKPLKDQSEECLTFLADLL